MSEERRAVILRRVQAGETMTAVARDIGVSRQYVSAVVKRAREGKTAGRRGRPKDQALLPDQADALLNHLSSLPQSRREGRAVIDWFKSTFDRPFSIHQLRKFCTDRGLRLRSPGGEGETAADAPSTTVLRRRGRPRNPSPSDPTRITESELAAMERSNAEVAARLAKSPRRPPQPVHRPTGQLRRNDPCPFDPSRKFKKCCGQDGSKTCHRQNTA